MQVGQLDVVKFDDLTSNYFDALVKVKRMVQSTAIVTAIVSLLRSREEKHAARGVNSFVSPALNIMNNERPK